MIQAIITAGMAFVAGWLMCAVFVTGKEDDYYWQGFESGQKYAETIIKAAEELNNDIENFKS